jgi:hypothetical protein
MKANKIEKHYLGILKYSDEYIKEKKLTPIQLKELLENFEIKKYEAEKDIYRLMGVTPIILKGDWGTDMEAYKKNMESKKPQAQTEGITEQLIESENKRFNSFADKNSNYQGAIKVIQIIKNTLEQEPEPKQQPEANKKTADYEEILSLIKKKENKFWKGLPMEVVIKHFEVMTTTMNKNGEPYLSKKQFISFLKRGFLNIKAEPIQKVNCLSGEKGFVIKRFYEFFALAAGEYKHPNKTERFISLFINCFDNWESDSVKPFFKAHIAKENW